ncbi:hypothetical protein SODG_004921 [Sodalis praecaptivus]
MTPHQNYATTADDEIMSLKARIGKMEGAGRRAGVAFKRGDKFKRSIISIYEKGLKNKTPSPEILIDIIADTYASLGYQGDSHELAL